MAHVMGADETGAAVIMAAYEAWFAGKAVSYSRRKANQHRHPLLTYTRLTREVDRLAAEGWLIHYKQLPGSHTKWQSAFEATPRLMIAVSEMLAEKPKLRHVLPNQLTIIRDANGEPIAYRPTREIDRQDRKTASINEAITSSNVTLASDENVNFACPVIRIFNQTSERGGRFYARGMSWQNLPSNEKKVAASAEKAAARGQIVDLQRHRRNLQIDGEATAELDYSEFHPSLLYKEAGEKLDMPAYDLPGWPRQLVKVATNIMLNAPNERKAHGAIANHNYMQYMCEPGTEDAKKFAWRLMEAIKVKHHRIIKHFNSDAGAKLMRQDSAIAEAVMTNLNKQGIVVLPIHDSFIVQKRHQDHLYSAMYDAAEKAGLRSVKIDVK